MKSDSEYWDINAVSNYLNIKSKTIYAWVSQNKIPHVKIHRLIRFEPDEIARWLERFRQARPKSSGPTLKGGDYACLDDLIARAKRKLYNPPHGETRPQSSLKKGGM